MCLNLTIARRIDAVANNIRAAVLEIALSSP